MNHEPRAMRHRSSHASRFTFWGVIPQSAMGLVRPPVVRRPVVSGPVVSCQWSLVTNCAYNATPHYNWVRLFWNHRKQQNVVVSVHRIRFT